MAVHNLRNFFLALWAFCMAPLICVSMPVYAQTSAWIRAGSDGSPPQFGPAVQPVNTPQLAMLEEPPPHELATDAEVVVVSGYEPSASVTRVVVRRPGNQVLLVLSSYEKVLWRIEPSPGTTIKGILVASSRPDSGVIGAAGTSVYRVQLPFTYDVDNINFRNLLNQLNAWFGVEKVDVHRGRYHLPEAVEIFALDAPRAELSMAGVQPEVPTAVFDFDLLTSDFRKVSYRNTGPKAPLPSGQRLLLEGKVAVSRFNRDIYLLANDELRVMNRKSGQTVAVPLPTSFPRFSWAMDLACDVHLNIVTVVTLGGEGYLYRYDAKNHRWLDYRSLNNIDITSLAYDPQGRRYAAWTSDGDLLFISNQGQALSSKQLGKQLSGFGATYDGHNRASPRLILAPRGPQIAILQVAAEGVMNIWTYDDIARQVMLTYKWSGH